MVKIAPHRKEATDLRKEVLGPIVAIVRHKGAIAPRKAAIVRPPVVLQRPSLRSNLLFRKL